MPSAEEIEAARSPRGGWTKAQLAEWGVPWPPPKGWKKELLDTVVFGAVVIDAGGGEVRLLVDRDTMRYPAPGDRVRVFVQPAPPKAAEERWKLAIDLEIGDVIAYGTAIEGKVVAHSVSDDHLDGLSVFLEVAGGRGATLVLRSDSRVTVRESDHKE